MKMNSKNISLTLLIAFAGLILSCSAKKDIPIQQLPIQQLNELELLTTMMTGSYNSAKQAKEDSSYYNISLHMFPIWKNKQGGKYLYVEQALASMQTQPYRQRVYKLVKLSSGQIASYVYTLKSDSLFIGKWNDIDYFDRFGLSILDEREGCEVILNRTLNGYEGSTVEDHCTSSLRGASYATSKVVLNGSEIKSWDQGFDDKNEQVWGAKIGPYIFDKIED